MSEKICIRCGKPNEGMSKIISPKVPVNPPKFIGFHKDCGGEVIYDPDFIGGGDSDEIWWTYRCLKCGDSFQTKREWECPE